MSRLRFACLAAASIALGCSGEGVVAAPPQAPAPPPDPGAPAPVASAAEPVTVKLGGGCDEAKEAYVRECTDNPRACPDSDPSQLAGTVSYGSVLNGGGYLDACRAPASMNVRICAAIRNGRAVGVTVKTDPGDGHVADCVGHAVQGLSFPSSPRLDVTSTVFAAP